MEIHQPSPEEMMGVGQSEKSEVEKRLSPGITAERCYAGPCIIYETEGKVDPISIIAMCCCCMGMIYPACMWKPDPTPEYTE